MDNILEIRELSKQYKDFSLHRINLTLERGYIMGFIGPNGAGKSTTIKLIMNLLRKDGGSIRLFGLDHIAHEQQIKERIGFVYDGNYFYEELTVRETMNLVAPFYRNWDRTMFFEYLNRFELPANKRVKDLSKGMKMKLSLSIALSHQAEFLIMDEPTSGLDPVVRNELLEILMELMQDEHKSVLFSTHITSDLDKIADYIALIDKGHLLFSKPKDELLEQHAMVRGDHEQLEAIRDLVVGIRKSQFGAEALVNNRHEARLRLGNKAVIEKPNLEEIMLFYTRSGVHV